MLSAGVKLRNIWYTDSSGEWVCLKDNYGEGDAIKNRSQQSSSYQKAKELILEKDKLIRMLIDLVQELSDEISEIKQQIPNSSELDDNT